MKHRGTQGSVNRREFLKTAGAAALGAAGMGLGWRVAEGPESGKPFRVIDVHLHTFNTKLQGSHGIPYVPFLRDSGDSTIETELSYMDRGGVDKAFLISYNAEDIMVDFRHEGVNPVATLPVVNKGYQVKAWQAIRTDSGGSRTMSIHFTNIIWKTWTTTWSWGPQELSCFRCFMVCCLIIPLGCPFTSSAKGVVSLSSSIGRGGISLRPRGCPSSWRRRPGGRCLKSAMVSMSLENGRSCVIPIDHTPTGLSRWIRSLRSSRISRSLWLTVGLQGTAMIMSTSLPCLRVIRTCTATWRWQGRITIPGLSNNW